MMAKTLKRKEFDRLEFLRRRADFLRKQLGIKPPYFGSRSYDTQELSALEWAIPLLEDHLMNKTITRLPAEVRKHFGFPLAQERSA